MAKTEDGASRSRSHGHATRSPPRAHVTPVSRSAALWSCGESGAVSGVTISPSFTATVSIRVFRAHDSEMQLDVLLEFSEAGGLELLGKLVSVYQKLLLLILECL